MCNNPREMPVIQSALSALASNEPNTVRAILKQYKIVSSRPPDLGPFCPVICDAIASGNIQIVDVILSEGFPVEGFPIEVAIAGRSIPVFETMVKHGWNINEPLLHSKPPALGYLP